MVKRSNIKSAPRRTNKDRIMSDISTLINYVENWGGYDLYQTISEN